MLQVLEGSSPVYPLWGLMLAAISLYLVPRDHYRYLLLNGLIGAMVAGMVVVFFSEVLEAFSFVQAFPYSVAGFPLFVALGWGAVIIVFLWAIPEKASVWLHGGYIAAFTVAGIAPEAMFHQLGLRPYGTWFSSWMAVFHVGIIFLSNYCIYRLRKRFENQDP